MGDIYIYSQPYDPDNIEKGRPKITLRSRDKFKFKAVFTRNTNVLSIPEWQRHNKSSALDPTYQI